MFSIESEIDESEIDESGIDESEIDEISSALLYGSWQLEERQERSPRKEWSHGRHLTLAFAFPLAFSFAFSVAFSFAFAGCADPL